jgi:hypothetical protein
MRFLGMGTNKEKNAGDEIAERRDAALLRALSTPHKRQKEMKLFGTRMVNGFMVCKFAAHFDVVRRLMAPICQNASANARWGVGK